MASRDLRWVQGPVAAVALCDGETLCSKVRSDEVQDGTSCGAKQRAGPCGFTHRRSRADHPPSTSHFRRKVCCFNCLTR